VKTRKLLMISTALATLTLTSSAADAASTYASLFGGANFLTKTNMKGGGTFRTTTYAFRTRESVDTSFKTGYVIGGNFGIDWGQFRTELEIAYRENASSKHGRVTKQYSTAYLHNGKAYKTRTTTTTTVGTVMNTHQHFSNRGYNKLTHQSGEKPLHLRVHTYSLMANAWYDFHELELPLGITPYVGGGIGLAEVQINGSINGATILTKNDVTFAWQFGAGASLPIGDQTSLFADYRYFSAVDPGFALQPGFRIGRVKADFDSHSVLVGVRFNFL